MARHGAVSRPEDGRHWERMAESFLRNRGLKLLDRNYRCRLGELDLIMQHGGQLVFVEVRYRRSNRCGDGLETVGPVKQRRISSAAAHYLARNPRRATQACRFDVVSIGGAGSATRVHWVRNAFESMYG
jgi:putative endonuclease